MKDFILKAACILFPPHAWEDDNNNPWSIVWTDSWRKAVLLERIAGGYQYLCRSWWGSWLFWQFSHQKSVMQISSAIANKMEQDADPPANHMSISTSNSSEMCVYVPSLCGLEWMRSHMDESSWIYWIFSQVLFCTVLQLDMHLLQKWEGAKRFLIDALFDNCIEPGRKNRHEENEKNVKKRTKGI